MFSRFEKLKVWFLLQVTWKRSQEKQLESIRLFASTEADSAWQLYYALSKLSNLEQQAELFAQALEETHHAEKFSALYKQMTPTAPVALKYEKKLLYEKSEDMWKLFVYCLIGEADAAHRFKYIAQFIKPGPIRTTLEEIVEDECGHIEKADALIESQTQLSQKEIKKELRQIRWRRFYESWLRSGRQVTDFFASLLLSSVYFAIGPFTTLPSRRRLRRGLQ